MKRKKIIFLGVVFTAALLLYFTKPQQPQYVQNYHLVKLDAKQNRLKPWDGPWRCVEDTNTKLVWELSSYDETLQDEKCSYSWYDGNFGVAKRGSCFTKDSKSDTKDIIDYLNTIKLCGYSDWRLPTTKELQTLLYYHSLPGDAMVEKSFFPRTHKELYWTSKIDTTTQKAEAVNFKDGSVWQLEFDNVARVKAVRSATKTTTP